MSVSNHLWAERWDKTTWLVEQQPHCINGKLVWWISSFTDLARSAITALDESTTQPQTGLDQWRRMPSLHPSSPSTRAQAFLISPRSGGEGKFPTQISISHSNRSTTDSFISHTHRTHNTKKYNYDRNFTYPNGAFFGYLFAGCLPILNHIVPLPWASSN